MRVDIITLNHNHPILSGGAVTVIRPENSANIMTFRTMAKSTAVMARIVELDGASSPENRRVRPELDPMFMQREQSKVLRAPLE